MPLFATVYFFFKFVADKYNLIFTYFKKNESGGRIKTSIGFLMTINLTIFLLTMMGIFGYSSNDLSK